MNERSSYQEQVYIVQKLSWISAFEHKWPQSIQFALQMLHCIAFYQQPIQGSIMEIKKNLCKQTFAVYSLGKDAITQVRNTSKNC